MNAHNYNPPQLFWGIWGINGNGEFIFKTTI